MKRNRDTEFNISIGKIMERRRLAEGLSRQQLLRLMNDHRSTSLLCNYELGHKPVSLPFALHWCEAVGISLSDLVEVVRHDMKR